MHLTLQNELFDLPLPNDARGKTVIRQKARSGSFVDNMRLPVHRWFRYSAGFSAQWVAQQIAERIQHEPVQVLDPFAGSATTLVAADSSGVSSMGFESHPFVYRIARAKLLWHHNVEEFLQCAELVLKRAGIAKEDPEAAPPPKLLLACYTPEALKKLDALRTEYLRSFSPYDPSWELVWLALTAILRPCSYVGTAQWQYILPNKRKTGTIDPFLAFRDLVSRMAEDMRTVQSAGYISGAKILLADARSPELDVAKQFDLVITSPPYPNNYDYADATRLEMTFWREIESWGDLHQAVRRFIVRSCSQHSAADKLSLDDLFARPSILPILPALQKVCGTLATVRLEKGGKKTYHTMVAAYFADLAEVWTSLRRLCKQGADVCFVVGDSAPYGVHVPVDQWLGELALAAGFKSFSFEKLRDRNMKWKNRKHRVPLHEGRLWVKG